eukprot:9467843-Alexandrium_andersonii.AAC.1
MSASLVGSEMCIRDSFCGNPRGVLPRDLFRSRPRQLEIGLRGGRCGARARRCGRAGAPAVG